MYTCIHGSAMRLSPCTHSDGLASITRLVRFWGGFWMPSNVAVNPRIMYDVEGEVVPYERQDPELEGYRCSAPVH